MPEEGGGSAAQDGFSAGNADDLSRFADSVRRFGADAVVVTSTDQVRALDLRPVIAAGIELISANEPSTELSPEHVVRSTPTPGLARRPPP